MNGARYAAICMDDRCFLHLKLCKQKRKNLAAQGFSGVRVILHDS
ncbi:hypothetical protein B4168_3389 [Anoxybacillus flavithermus]|nr:hypothetical protein GT20_0557 [Parageobacillus thermoglucosidasius TNO-09.020]KYD13587.1 hypothetical protein B4168_3389 [Anoxybacillus flavithermus]OAO85039.1 hypothetical protein GT23_3093 [Parageobacillus thermoglucosidasius]